MRYSRWVLLASIVILSLCVPFGCGSGGGGGSAGGGEDPITAQLIVGRSAGTVGIPAGAALDRSSLSVSTVVGDTKVAADGKYSVPTFTGSPMFTTVSDKDGNIVMLGWTDANHTVINARTTAEVLVYFGLACYVLEPKHRLLAVKDLSTNPAVNPVATAIEDAIRRNPAQALSDPAVHAALQTATESLRPRNVGAMPASQRTRGVRNIDPNGAQSGVRVEIAPGINTIKLIGTYRRRAYVFIEREWYQLDDGSQPKYVPAKLTSFEAPSSSGVQDFIGPIIDLMNGTSAYAEQNSDDVPLALYPDMEKAKSNGIKVILVGHGFKPGAIDQLDAEQLEKQKAIVRETLLKDYLLPMLFNICAPLVCDILGDAHKDAAQIIAAINETTSIITTQCPDIWQKAYEGNMREALLAAYSAIHGMGSVREGVFRAVHQVIAKRITWDAFKEKADHFFAVADLSAIVLTFVDVAITTYHFQESNRADVWHFTIDKPKVKLLPSEADVQIRLDDLPLQAQVTELQVAGQPEVPVAFQWSLEGDHGTITDGQHTGSSFSSSSNTVTYTAKGSSEGVDTVVVKAYAVDGANHEYIGKAESKISVKMFDGRWVGTIYDDRFKRSFDWTYDITSSPPNILHLSFISNIFGPNTTGQYDAVYSGTTYHETAKTSTGEWGSEGSLSDDLNTLTVIGHSAPQKITVRRQRRQR